MNSFPNSMYPPYGTNDNNFNRRGVPSNIHPNYASNANPMNQYNPITTNTKFNMNNVPSMSNFNDSFAPNPTLIERRDYVNRGGMLHNNVAERVLDENVVEYRLNLDSEDRDINYYPDPFFFVVKFNPPGRSTVQQEVYIDSKKKSKGSYIQETQINGPPMPYINREFRNVKYVKLENIIIPQFTDIITTDGEDEYDITSNILADRYVGLTIKELESSNIVTTSDNVTRYDPNTGKYYTPPKPFAIVIPDKNLITHYSGLPFYGSKIYKNSDLGNIGQLTIDFRNSRGAPLRVNGIYDAKTIHQRELDNDPIPITDIRHPLNARNQVHVSFIIGVVESQINTNTKFEL